MSSAATQRTDAPDPTQCPRCGTEIAPRLLHCPVCRWLVHAERLADLAREAERLTAAGERVEARSRWRRALELLPRESTQHAEVARRIDAIGLEIDAANPGHAASSRDIEACARGESPDPQPSRNALEAAAAGVVGAALLVWKFKAVLAFVATKGKLLALGLTKSSTFFSMLLSLGVYWTVFGSTFALGLVLSIYVHEIGHVAALRQLGIRASAPMFVPGLGALVRLKEYPASAREDARVGLAGPLWGMGASLFAFVVFLATGWPILAAIARVGAWLNLFNLIPVWQLDGSRGLRALCRRDRFLVFAVAAGVGLLIEEMLFGLVAAAVLIRAFGGGAPEQSDPRALGTFVLLLLGLGALCALEVPGVDSLRPG